MLLLPNVSPSANTDSSHHYKDGGVFFCQSIDDLNLHAKEIQVYLKSLLLPFDINSQHQGHDPTAIDSNSHTALITPTNTVTAEENNTNIKAEIQSEDAQIDENEFYNISYNMTGTWKKQRECHSTRYNKFVEIHPSQCKQDDNDPEMCVFVLTVNTVKPKNIKKAIANSAWIEAMQDELHQFDRLQVWELVDKSFGKTIIKLKWLWKNKKDEDQTVIHNKDRLVAKGYAQEEDGFIDPDHPEKVYHLRKALYGLKQAPRAWYDELLNCLMSKGFTKGKSIGTPMTTKPKLDADLSGNPVDQTDYRSKIGSLMYLTSSRPDIVQADSGFELTAFSDADHTECLDTRKNTFGGIHFLGDKLVSWMSKKHNCTAMSSAEAEYVALSASCAQVMWMRTQLKDYGFNYKKIPLYCDSQSAITISCNPVQHSRTKHIHTRYHFIKEQVENGIIELYIVITEYQLAGMFTKAHPEERFQYLVRRIGMRCLTPAELEVLTNESA
ncbi:retrovirus-related pol polyprotein from transposon TNT 1-94 [Tanacetum coccineum]